MLTPRSSDASTTWTQAPLPDEDIKVLLHLLFDPAPASSAGAVAA